MAEQKGDFLPCIVRAPGCAVVLSEGLTRDGVESPFGRPVQSPGEFSFTGFNVRLTLNTV